MSRRARGLALPLLSTLAGCASVLGIPNDSPSFCARNQGHAYCEDFDVGDPSARWTYVTSYGPTGWTLEPSDDSPPNLIALSSKAIPADAGPALVGFDKEFTDAGFVGLHIEADMRLVTPPDAGFQGAIGFMLITDKEGGCVALEFNPQGIGAANIVTPQGCSVLTSPNPGPDVDAGHPMQNGTVLGPLPHFDTWSHLVIDVTPDGTGQGSGTFTLNVVGQPTGYTPLPIAKGTLVSSGAPLVGFSNAAQPGASAIEVQYDNVTIDLSP